MSKYDITLPMKLMNLMSKTQNIWQVVIDSCLWRFKGGKHTRCVKHH